ncbi:STAS domain-containing protein [Desulfovibrio sp. OttesenSCG-928-F07]|nr:STAS domain-containing protein [Desulfovibrio sp. OttesenSCG-928-F07]
MKKEFRLDILNEVFTRKEHPLENNESGQHCLPEVFTAFNGKVMVVSYSGQIGLSVIDDFKPSLFATLTGGAQQIIVDFEDVTDVSRSALGAIVDFASTVLGRGKKMYLLMPPQSLEKSLKELQLTSFFKVLHKEEGLVTILPDE